MKYLKNIALAIALGAIFTLSAYAGGNPQGGGPGNGGPGKSTHYGLSDSCWNVFLSQLSPADQASIAADQKTIADNGTQIGTLNQQIGTLIKGSTGRGDTTNRAKIKALEAQIDALNQASGKAQMDIDTILKNNGKLFETVAQNCGRPINTGGGGRDTTKGGGRDTTKGGGPGNGGPGKGGRGHFGLSDSCWNIFLTQLSAADAAALAADQKIITDNQTAIDGLFKQIKALQPNAKDSATRVQIKALLDQIKTLMKASGAAEKDYSTIIRNNQVALQSIRKDCGRPAHKGTTGGGDPTTALTVSDITPNPAASGSSASITLTLTVDAPVTISLSTASAQLGAPPKVIFNGLLTAGTHTEAIDLTGLKAGAYLVSVQSGNEMITKKLVVQ